MRYAIISDLHANRQALSAVLTDIDSLGVDRIICLGDVVGYGPAPADVLETAYTRVHDFVLGNHDAVVAGSMDADAFNDAAREAIEWTAAQLDRKAARFFRDVPAVIEGDGFRCVHGEAIMPLRFGYILETKDALLNFDAFDDRLLFVGHSHCPGFFVTGESGRVYPVDPEDFRVEEDKRYIVNVGSVGLPRDGDARACYCIFDAEQRGVYFRRVRFDLDGFRVELKASGLPVTSYPFLGPRGGNAAPVREILQFRPLSTEQAAAQGDPVVRRLEAVERQARRWRKAGLLLATLAAGLAMFSVAVYVHLAPTDVRIPAAAAATLPETLTPGASDRRIELAIPTAGVLSEKTPFREWSFWVEKGNVLEVNARTGADEVSREPDAYLRLVSQAPVAFELRSQPFAVSAGMRLAVQGRFRPVELGSGYVEMVLLFVTDDGVERVVLAKKPPNLDTPGEWGVRRSSKTMTADQLLPADGTVHYVLRGQFEGTVDCGEMCLMVKPGR